VDARVLLPSTLAAMPVAEVQQLALPHGRETLAVADLFDVHRSDDAADIVILEGDMSRLDALGAGLDAGTIEVHGPAGDAAGLGMSGGRLTIHGNARDLAGCSMRGGWLDIAGDIGDFGASALPGDLDGMRGGTLQVRGRAGARLCDRMRRGTVMVWGECGDFAASRMVAGTLVLNGGCGANPAWGMRRGTLLFAGQAPAVPPTFVPLHSSIDVFWPLLARDLARFGAPFTELAQRSVQRYAGDLAVDGKGEWLIVR
jgi:formylmethanofuran dehydrogenase subunit C